MAIKHIVDMNKFRLDESVFFLNLLNDQVKILIQKLKEFKVLIIKRQI